MIFEPLSVVFQSKDSLLCHFFFLESRAFGLGGLCHILAFQQYNLVKRQKGVFVREQHRGRVVHISVSSDQPL